MFWMFANIRNVMTMLTVQQKQNPKLPPKFTKFQLCAVTELGRTE